MIRQTRYSLAVFALLAVLIGGVLLTQSNLLRELFSTEGFEPHGHCFLWIPTLVRLYSVSDLLIGLSYTVISIVLTYLVYKASRDIPFHWVFLAFGAFIFTCGITHFMDVITLWTPTYWLAAGMKAITAVASVATAVIMPPLTPRVLGLIRSARLSEQRKSNLIRANSELEVEIARRRRIEDELRAALEREQQLSEFRMNIIIRLNHEFRNPLAAARTSSELLRTYFSQLSEAQRQERIETIQHEIDQMALLLDDILTIGKLESGRAEFQPQPVDLEDLCREIIHEERAKVSDQHRILFQMDGKCREVVVDPKLVAQILINLLENALKYSPKGGDIRADLACTSTIATIRVSDEGMGIPQEDQPHVFEAFYRGSNSSDIDGTGLGLSIVRRAVDLHKGQIDIQSQPERGTTVTVKLPIFAQTTGGA
jgi:signal transduction histidine kinase